MRPRLLLAAAALAALLAPAATTFPAHAAPDDVLLLPAGDGTVLRVERAPFRLALRGPDGAEQVATVPGLEGPPVRVPGVDGPQPVEPLGPLGGFPALGFVVGVAPSVGYPLPLFTGNRLFGAETGVLVSLVEVVARSACGRAGSTWPCAPTRRRSGPARVRLRPLAGGGVRLELEPPPGVTPVSSRLQPGEPRRTRGSTASAPARTPSTSAACCATSGPRSRTPATSGSSR